MGKPHGEIRLFETKEHDSRKKCSLRDPGGCSRNLAPAQSNITHRLQQFPVTNVFFDCANLVNSIHKWVCSLALNPLSLVVIRTITDLFRWCIREFLVKLTKVNSYPPTNGIRVKSASQARGLHLGMRNDATGA